MLQATGDASKRAENLILSIDRETFNSFDLSAIRARGQQTNESDVSLLPFCTMVSSTVAPAMPME